MDPGASHHLLLPGLVDAQVGGVDKAAQDQVSEVLAEVVERHPAGREERRESGYQQEGKAATAIKIEEMRSGIEEMVKC